MLEVKGLETHILVVEDDLDLNFILCKLLQKEGYRFKSAFSGKEAELLLEQNTFDLVLLDLMLPEVSGEELILKIRSRQEIPIMVISSKVQLQERIHALDSGADDYLIKPFELQEVSARIRVLLRRSKSLQKAAPSLRRLNFRELVLLLDERICLLKETPLSLTATEFDLLTHMLREPKKVFTKRRLYEAIWQDEHLTEDNALNVHISNLRKKLKHIDPESEYIETIWGVGFKLKD